VTTSSTESELVACADAIPYVVGVRKLLVELGFSIGPTVIHQDKVVSRLEGPSKSVKRPDVSVADRRCWRLQHCDGALVVLENNLRNDLAPLGGEKPFHMEKDS
jgi:hypothetical protein